MLKFREKLNRYKVLNLENNPKLDTKFCVNKFHHCVKFNRSSSNHLRTCLARLTIEFADFVSTKSFKTQILILI